VKPPAGLADEHAVPSADIDDHAACAQVFEQCQPTPGPGGPKGQPADRVVQQYEWPIEQAEGAFEEICTQADNQHWQTAGGFARLTLAAEDQQMTPYFSIQASDRAARLGVLKLPHGNVHTPAFMPVGTQAAVKALDPADVRALGAEILLANTYHLMLRPGEDLIESFGGVGSFMAWSGPVLTDSGGFQVFSLASQRTVRPDGVEFQSHIDGSRHLLTPERAILVQRKLGADVSMVLDVCTGYDAMPSEQREAARVTHAWLPACIETFRSFVPVSEAVRPLLFGICQGGFDPRLRAESAATVSASEVDGCAIGGLSVGEPKEVLAEMLRASIAKLDIKRPRYLMGVGAPEDLWDAVATGVDMFDCVLPTRVARHGGLYTPHGRVNIRTARFRLEMGPVDSECDCYACTTFSAGYLHHLFRAGELLAYRLASIHNLRFIFRQMQAMREAIAQGTFESARRAFLDRYAPVDQEVREQQRRRYRAALRAG
jgi:queuine tRNA-ribosyltransferase